MSEEHPSYVRCASGHRAFLDCEVSQVGSLIRLVGYVPMDFVPEDAACLGQALIACARKLGWRAKDNDPLIIPEMKTVDVDSGDAIVDETIALLLARAKLGQKKYGTTLMRDDLTLLDWMRHAIEEGLDQTLYQLRAIKDLEQFYDDGR